MAEKLQLVDSVDSEHTFASKAVAMVECPQCGMWTTVGQQVDYCDHCDCRLVITVQVTLYKVVEDN